MMPGARLAALPRGRSLAALLCLLKESEIYG